MRKEVIFAIITGALLGIVIAFGIWKANLTLKTNSTNNHKAPKQTTPMPPQEEVRFKVSSPDNLSIAAFSPINIKGVSPIGSLIVISTEEKDFILNPDDSGNFQQEISLSGGINEIKISSINSDKIISNKTLLTTYSTKYPNSDEGEAYIGTVTDITEASIQIKAHDGEFKQISVADETVTFASIVSETKDIQFEDLAIGDYVIAMGSKNDNGVLVAKRIVVTEAFEPSTIKLIVGEVVKVEKKEITVKNSSGESFTATPAKKANIVKILDGGKETKITLSDIEMGFEVILVTAKKDDTIEARTIFVI